MAKDLQSSGVDSFPRVAVTNHHMLDDLKEQTFIPPGFWRLEVPNQGVSWAMLSLKCWVEFFLLLFSF